MAQIDLKNATLFIFDGTGTPNELEIKIGEGNFTYSEKRNIEYKKDRGLLDITREGDEEPMEISFDFVWEWVKSSTGYAITPFEALKQVGQASAWATSGAACEPYAVDLVVEVDVSCGTIQDETLTFNEFRWESLDSDLRAGTVSCKGKCNSKVASSVRSTL